MIAALHRLKKLKSKLAVGSQEAAQPNYSVPLRLVEPVSSVCPPESEISGTSFLWNGGDGRAIIRLSVLSVLEKQSPDYLSNSLWHIPL